MKSAKWVLVLVMLFGCLNINCGDKTVKQDGPQATCQDQNADGFCDEMRAQDNGPARTCVDQDADGRCDRRIEEEEEDGVDIDVNVSTCASNDDCYEEEICVVDLALTERFGHTIQVCDLACDVDTESHLGSTCVVAGSDSCQRDGNEDLYCMGGKCRELTKEEKEEGAERLYCDEQEGNEGEGEGAAQEDAETDQVVLTVCYSNIPAGYFVQMSWSTATPQDPSAWDAGRDRTAGADGCGSTEPINRDSIAVGFWADVTRVRAEDAAPGDWLTTGATLVRAYLTTTAGTEDLSIRYFEYGKGRRVGRIGGDDPGCGDSIATCTAP